MLDLAMEALEDLGLMAVISVAIAVVVAGLVFEKFRGG